MLQLTHQMTMAADVLGEEAVKRLVMRAIASDARDMFNPYVLLDDDTVRHVFLAEFESPVLAVAKPAPVTLFGYYFTWDSPGPRPTLADALATTTGGAPVAIDPEAPIGLMNAIAARLRVIVNAVPPVQVWASTLPLEAARRAWAAGAADIRDAAQRAAARLIDPRAVEALDLPSADRFDVLDRTIAEAGLDCLLVTSPIHVQGVTGFPLDRIAAAGLAALYRRGESDVILFARSPQDFPDASSVGAHLDLADAVVRHGGHQLGYEELHLQAGLAHRLLDRRGHAHPASDVVRRWEDRMGGTETGAFLLAALSTVWATEQTISNAWRLRHDGRVFSEEDLAATYDDALRRFSVSVGLADNIKPHFKVIQAGERTLYPAVPTPYAITERTRTIKFDMGNRVVDSRGLVRGCSDLARTCAFTPSAAEMTAVLDNVIREDLPTVVWAGVSGDEVYQRGIEALRGKAGRIRSLGYLPEDRDVEDYRRDFGHTLGRQSPASVHFSSGDKGIVENSMIVCTEIVWPLGQDVFAQEDAWVLTSDGLVNLTRFADTQA